MKNLHLFLNDQKSFDGDFSIFYCRSITTSCIFPNINNIMLYSLPWLCVSVYLWCVQLWSDTIISQCCSPAQLSPVLPSHATLCHSHTVQGVHVHCLTAIQGVHCLVSDIWYGIMSDFRVSFQRMSG